MSVIECKARSRFGFIRWWNDGMMAISITFFTLLVTLLLIQMYKEERHFVKTVSKILNQRSEPCVKGSKRWGKHCNKSRPSPALISLCSCTVFI